MSAVHLAGTTPRHGAIALAIIRFLLNFRRVSERSGRLAERQDRRRPVKSNARCWTLPAVAPLIATLWLAACGMAGFEGQAPCPPVVEYSPAEQTRAAAEIETLSEGTVLVGMLSDYAVLRDQTRTCR